MAEIIDGRAVARQLEEKTKAQVDEMVAAGMPRPGLTVILVGDDGASEVYVRRKIKACERVGIRSSEHRLPADTSQADLLALIEQLNADPEVHGILCQVPSARKRMSTGSTRSMSGAYRPVPAGSCPAPRWA
jgi:methylenetetrahydrofolate dehydrogenase (NADP+)/methenyltetrahydrofolate cyclohydrolase